MHIFVCFFVQNLPKGAEKVGSLKLTYISKVSHLSLSSEHGVSVSETLAHDRTPEHAKMLN